MSLPAIYAGLPSGESLLAHRQETENVCIVSTFTRSIRGRIASPGRTGGGNR
jgi:hypothetical protein